MTALPPLLPTVRDRVAPFRHPLVPLEADPASLDRLAVAEDLTVDQKPATLEALAGEVVEDLTVDDPPA